MADNDELQTARLILTGAGSYVDNDVADLEAALRTIFKITADQDLSAVASIGSGPDMTMAGTLTLAADPTEGAHACTKQYIDNTGGGGGATRCTVNLTSTQTVLKDAIDVLSWDATHFEAGGDCWAGGYPTRLVAPIDGDYWYCGVVSGHAAGGEGHFDVRVKLNGTTWIYDFLSLARSEVSTTENVGASFNFMEPMDAGDYVEIFVHATQADQVIAVDTQASMVLLG